MPRRKPDPSQIPELAGLNDKEREAAMLIADTGMTWTEALRSVGYTHSSAKVRASELRAQKNQAFRRAVIFLTSERMQSLAAKAISTLERAMDAPNTVAATRAAVEILNRTGLVGGPRRVEVDHHHEHTLANPDCLTLEEAEKRLKETLAQLTPEDRIAVLGAVPEEARPVALEYMAQVPALAEPDWWEVDSPSTVAETAPTPVTIVAENALASAKARKIASRVAAARASSTKGAR